MKKLFLALFILDIAVLTAFAQSDDDFFFDDDVIEEVEDSTSSSSQGIIFENGSVKIGGSLSASISTTTPLFSKEDKTFSDNLKDTAFTPVLSSTLSVDARPTQDLRIYTKLAFSYPFTNSSIDLTSLSSLSSINLSDVINVKECFTDFNLGDNVFFRFGVHTVSWGTGLFYSPVSDLINTSSINPEDTDAQVDGALNLRTQITFPDSLNCLWLYVVAPSDNKAIHTALAGKYEFLLGGWEFGTGLVYQYESAPKAMITASGSIKKLAVFGEAVYQYGADKEWSDDSDWNNKTSIFRGTLGITYMWKDPGITLATQYYYDGNNVDYTQFTGAGHNFAFLTNFSKIGNAKDLSISLLGIVNVGRVTATKDNLTPFVPKDLDPSIRPQVINRLDDVAEQINNLPSAIFSATVNYAVTSNLSFGAGPYITVTAWDEKPTVALKLSARLGGGNY